MRWFSSNYEGHEEYQEKMGATLSALRELRFFVVGY
jgi:hypothetical protein